jgi:hypothetical protein
MNESVFKAYSRYYDLLYSDKDYESEVKYILHLLKRNGVTKGNILELGSGTGKPYSEQIWSVCHVFKKVGGE